MPVQEHASNKKYLHKAAMVKSVTPARSVVFFFFNRALLLLYFVIISMMGEVLSN